MGTKSQTTYRRRKVIIQVGLTAIVVIVAVVMVLYLVISGDGEKKPAGTETTSIRVASSA